MPNLEKESFIANIILKRYFQMALMNVKNLVYNKFFVLLIQFRFWLFWLTVIIIYMLIIITVIIITIIIIIITIAFIILLLSLLYFIIIVIIIIVLSIINVVYFILSHFISYCSYYYDFCLCIAWDVYVSSRIFSPLFLLMIYIL